MLECNKCSCVQCTSKSTAGGESDRLYGSIPLSSFYHDDDDGTICSETFTAGTEWNVLFWIAMHC